MALPNGQKNVTVTLEITAEVDSLTAQIIRDRIAVGGDSTFISENVSIFDFEPLQVVAGVVVND